MKVYEDVFCGDEIISDSYDMNFVFDNVGAEVESKWITVGGENIDIGCGNAFGGNDDEAAETQKVLDLIDNFKYQETAFTKADYTKYIKGYMKKVKEHLEKTNPDRV
jgi:hypothetical protein